MNRRQSYFILVIISVLVIMYLKLGKLHPDGENTSQTKVLEMSQTDNTRDTSKKLRENTDKTATVFQNVNKVSQINTFSTISETDSIQLEYPEKSNQVADRTKCTIVYKQTKPDNFTGKIIRNFEMNCWMTADVKCDLKSDFERTMLKTKAGNTPIYVYSIKEDMWVSGSIIRGGLWESGLLHKIHSLLKEDPELTFIDLGCNIGEYSLMAAMTGRKVISIDMLPGNVLRLYHSLLAGKLGDNVTIIHNAVSNSRRNVTFGKHRGNIGGSAVANITNKNKDSKEIVNSIFLDDILDIFKLQKVIIKMDIETHEAAALSGAEKFFSNVFVKYILAEVVANKKFISEFMMRHNMVPYDTRISPTDTSKWPRDVLWRHKDVKV